MSEPVPSVDTGEVREATECDQQGESHEEVGAAGCNSKCLGCGGRQGFQNSAARVAASQDIASSAGHPAHHSADCRIRVDEVADVAL